MRRREGTLVKDCETKMQKRTVIAKISKARESVGETDIYIYIHIYIYIYIYTERERERETEKGGKRRNREVRKIIEQCQKQTEK